MQNTDLIHDLPAGGAVVVGGVNIDLCGHSFAPLIAEDSNPGRVSVSLGGVGRNIAHNLSLLGVPVCLLTAYGGDPYGDMVVSSCASLGIDLSHALRIGDAATSTYLFITGPEGDMKLAVNDMAICERITPEYLDRNLRLLRQASLVIADTNLPQESLCFLAEHCTAPILIDPVSTVKAEKLRPILGRIHTLKPNRLELAALSGLPVDSTEDVKRAAELLIGKGIGHLFVSLGADGICYAEDGLCLSHRALSGPAVSANGCGDAATAAIAWAALKGMDPEETMLAALAAGAITMGSPETVSSGMSEEALVVRMRSGR